MSARPKENDPIVYARALSGSVVQLHAGYVRRTQIDSKDCVYLIVSTGGGQPRPWFNIENEGITWCRGTLDSDAAKALAVACALR